MPAPSLPFLCLRSFLKPSSPSQGNSGGQGPALLVRTAVLPPLQRSMKLTDRADPETSLYPRVDTAAPQRCLSHTDLPTCPSEERKETLSACENSPGPIGTQLLKPKRKNKTDPLLSPHNTEDPNCVGFHKPSNSPIFSRCRRGGLEFLSVLPAITWSCCRPHRLRAWSPEAAPNFRSQSQIPRLSLVLLTNRL